MVVQWAKDIVWPSIYILLKEFLKILMDRAVKLCGIKKYISANKEPSPSPWVYDARGCLSRKSERGRPRIYNLEMRIIMRIPETKRILFIILLCTFATTFRLMCIYMQWYIGARGCIRLSHRFPYCNPPHCPQTYIYAPHYANAENDSPKPLFFFSQYVCVCSTRGARVSFQSYSEVTAI